MAKQTFSGINVKGAAITGAILGFLCWLLVIPFGLYGYGMMGYYGGYGMMGYGNHPYNYGNMGYMMGGVFHNLTLGYMMNGTFHQFNETGYYPVMDALFHGYSIYSIAIDVILGALAGLVIAIIYNWTLKLK